MGTTAQKLEYLANAVSGIKSAIEARGVVVGEAPLAQYASKIEEIPDNIASVVDKSVTEITAGMLEGITEIGDYAFYGCADLATVVIPGTVTSIGDYAFYGCSSLATIYFRGTTSQWAAVTKGTSWDGNTGAYSVVCGSVGLSFTSNGDSTCSVSGIGTCTDTDIVIPDVSPDGDTVTSIANNAFQDCTGLTSVTVQNSVTSIGNFAFYLCSGLTLVTISDSVTSLGYGVFSGCSGLTSVTLGNGVTSIGDYAFADCTGLTSITIPNSVINIGSFLLTRCSSLVSITIPFVGNRAGVTAADTYQYPLGYIFGTSSYAGGVGVTQTYHGRSTSAFTSTTYCIPASLRSVTVTGGEILYGAFYYCTELTSITLPNSITSIGGSAFNACRGLTAITIPASVSVIEEYAFRYCRGLTSITIPNGLTSIGSGVFQDCTGLTSVTIPDGVTIIGGSAFSGCTGLTSVSIPSSVTSIGNWAFLDCTGLTAVTIMPITPPVLGGSRCFNGSYPIYVPAGSVEAYKAATNWTEYASRIQAI